jgi:PAS domain S-box-containing protein
VERILGYRPEELIGRNLAEYVAPEDGPLLATFLSEMLRQPQTLVPVELRCRHQDRSWHILGIMGQNLLDDPLLQGIILNAQDITERRQLEEQLRQSQKMDAIGRLAGGVAHDFNNMLGVITGYSDLLLHRVGADENTRACLGEIMKAAERAAGLTRQLLLFSRQEVQSRQVLDLGDVAANMLQMLRRLIDADIELVTLLDPAAGAVNADAGQMEQVLLNLAVNARDAMPQGGQLTIATQNVYLEAGGGRVAARQHPGVPPGAYVRLSVSDTGCGMEESTQARIFEPFFTTKEPGKGTGLGLATVYGIMQQHEGHIRVESQLGQGTTFHLYLPRTDEPCRPATLPAAAAPPPTGSETILLVEDEPIVRRLVQEILRLSGYAVLTALQGDEALRLCEQHQETIDLLLTDVVMPGIGGRELAERAAALRPTLKVLFMSGYTDDAVLRHGVSTAAMAFIRKPFKPAALAQKVREVLETS